MRPLTWRICERLYALAVAMQWASSQMWLGIVRNPDRQAFVRLTSWLNLLLWLGSRSNAPFFHSIYENVDMSESRWSRLSETSRVGCKLAPQRVSDLWIYQYVLYTSWSSEELKRGMQHATPRQSGITTPNLPLKLKNFPMWNHARGPGPRASGYEDTWPVV